ncbi:MAG: alpha/beta hydrolase, partial [Alphaproteobacteria bacterium]
TMMSLHVGLRRRTAPAAIVGYSGALAGAEYLKQEMKGAPPVLMVHGDADDMIPIRRMHEAVAALGEADVPVRWHISRGVGHGIAPDGLALGGQFLSDAFAGRLGVPA